MFKIMNVNKFRHMNHLLIVFSTHTPYLLHNIHRAFKLIGTQDEKIQAKVYRKRSYTPHYLISEAQKISRRFGMVSIIIGEKLDRAQIKDLTVLTANLTTPYCLLIESLAQSWQHQESEMIKSISAKAHSIFTFSGNTTDTLTHHYQIDQVKITRLHYGCWPSTVQTTDMERQNQLALLVDSETIQDLEQVVLSIPRLNKLNPQLHVRIYTSACIDKESQWMTRNKLLIRKLNLASDISWHELNHENISDLAHRNKLLVFAWHGNYGGNQCLRYELMASGGVVVCLNDSFAQDQLSGPRALLIDPETTQLFSESLSSYYSNAMAHQEIRETSALEKDTMGWLTPAKKIKANWATIQNRTTQMMPPKFDLLLAPRYKASFTMTIKRLISDLEPDKITDVLWLITRNRKKSEISNASLTLKYLNRISNGCCNKNMQQEFLFELSFGLIQLAKNNSGSISKAIALIFEKMAPMVEKDFLPIELLYHQIQYRNRPTQSLKIKIEERSQYLMQILEESIDQNMAKNKMGMLKMTVTLLEAANLINDSQMVQQAIEVLHRLENAIFSTGGYRPAANLDSSEIMPFTYWLSHCHQLIYPSKVQESALLQEQMSAWFFGFNDKNKIYYNSENGFCCVHTKETTVPTHELLQETLYFWLFQKNYHNTIIRSYHTPQE